MTKLVKTTCPNVSMTRKTVSGHSMKLYVGLRKKISFPSSFEFQGSPDPLIFYDIPEVKKLKDSAMHASAILLSQHNQKLQNNFKLMLTTLVCLTVQGRDL